MDAHHRFGNRIIALFPAWNQCNHSRIVSSQKIGVPDKLYGKDSFSEFLCSDEKIATKVLELLLQCDRYMTDEGPEQKEDCCSQLHANHLCLSW
jgi:hypothetical protein